MPAPKPLNIQPKRILVITLRYLGDTLLVTPLISSLKQAYPFAEIDVLLPAGNVGMLEGNPDINRLIPVVGKSGARALGCLLFGLWRRYDLAISTQAGDRPALCAIVAGKVSMSFVPEQSAKNWWKRLLLDRALVFSEGYTHAVLENLRFCELLNIEPQYRLTAPRPLDKGDSMPKSRYAVLHIMPQWQYKQWPVEGWIEVAYFLNRNGYQVVLTGSSQPDERRMLDEIQRKLPPSTLNLAGQLSLAQLALLIEGSALFVGPDTGITHLAAAAGAPVVAIFGPTDPAKWAPWPAGYAKNITPFSSRGSRCINNVFLIQGGAGLPCVPCQREGCDGNRQSRSDCLEKLAAETVISALTQFLNLSEME